MRKQTITVVVALVVLTALVGVSLAFTPTLEVVHEHDEHGETLEDVEYDDLNDIVWSLDGDGTFVAYDVAAEDVVVNEEFEMGHALAVGDDLVYIAAGDTLWEWDVADEESSELTSLEDHAAAIDYDEARDIVWVAGHETVYGYDVGDGSLIHSHDEHTDGMSDIAVQGDYVASATTWHDEVIVYDIEAEEVAFEPELPDDVSQTSSVHLTESEELIVGTGADDGDVVAMYDIETEELLAQYREHIFSVSAVEYDAEHDVIISLGFDNTIKFYDVGSESIVAEHVHEDTIFTADLDLQNDLLWFGDGEDRDGFVTGLDVSSEDDTTPTPPPDDPTPTPTPPPDEPTPTPPTDDPTPTPDDPTPSPAPDDDDGIPGFGVAIALTALGGAGYLLNRRS